MSKEQLFSHVAVKGALFAALFNLIQENQLGLMFTDGVLLSNFAADISGNPDGLFLIAETIKSDRVRVIEGRTRWIHRTPRIPRYGARSSQRQLGREGFGNSSSGRIGRPVSPSTGSSMPDRTQSGLISSAIRRRATSLRQSGTAGSRRRCSVSLSGSQWLRATSATHSTSSRCADTAIDAPCCPAYIGSFTSAPFTRIGSDGRRHPQGRGADRGPQLHPHLPRPAHRHQARRQRDGRPRRACAPPCKYVVFMETVGLRPVLVHGGGKPIDRAMAAAGLVPQEGPGPPLHRRRDARHRRPRPDRRDQRRHRPRRSASSAAGPSACTPARCSPCSANGSRCRRIRRPNRSTSAASAR